MLRSVISPMLSDVRVTSRSALRALRMTATVMPRAATGMMYGESGWMISSRASRVNASSSETSASFMLLGKPAALLKR